MRWLILASIGWYATSSAAFDHPVTDLRFQGDTLSVLGHGLVPTRKGFYTQPCLARFDLASEGSAVDFEVYPVEEGTQPADPELDRFIRTHQPHALKYSPTGGGSSSFVLAIQVRKSRVAVRDETMTLKPTIAALLDRGDLEAFYRQCGTHYVSAVTKKAKLFVFVSYYRATDAARDRIQEAVRRRITADPFDGRQIRLFKDLDFTAYTYFALEASGGLPVTPINFTASKWSGERMDDFIRKAMTSLMYEEAGDVSRFDKKSWEELPALQNACRSAAAPNFCKRGSFSSLRLMEQDLLELSLRAAKAVQAAKADQSAGSPAAPETARCAKFLRNARRYADWNRFEECRAAYLASPHRDLRTIPVCEKLGAALQTALNNPSCDFNVRKGLPHEQFLHGTTHLPIPFIPPRFASSPNREVFGKQFDVTGRVYADSCILLNAADIDSSPLYSKTRYLYHPLTQTGSGSGRPPKVSFKAIFEIRGFSSRLSDQVTPSSSALVALQEGLLSFFQKCGTHFAAGFEHHRGFEVKLTMGLDDVIEFKPRPKDTFQSLSESAAINGVTLKQLDVLVDPSISHLEATEHKETARVFEEKDRLDVLDRSEVELEPFGLAPQYADHPLLKPRTFREYFEKKERIVALFRDDTHAVPTELYLQPWTETLRAKGFASAGRIDAAEDPRFHAQQ